MKNNIVLIGLPSSGKSTVGVLLAKNLGMRFLDTDLLIQERDGRLLHEIIAEGGNAAFLALEDCTLAALDAEGTVISTGGSAVYGMQAMRHLGEIGHVIYLKIDYETLERRLGDYSHRGVVLREGKTLRDLYEERAALYEHYADATVDEKDTEGDLTKTVERTLAVCRQLLKK
jgi:shikimate kinase